MSRALVVSLFLLSALLQIPTTQPQAPGNNASAAPGNNTSGAPVAPIAPDPAAVVFKSDVGVVLVAVKPDKTADYEAVITALQEALSKSTDPAKRTLAEGWKVYKATETDAKAAAIYVHHIAPTVSEADYRPSLLLDELLAGAPADLLAKYRDAFAAPPAKLALAEIAHMSVAPVPKPSNASPAGPGAGNASPGKPGNASPAKPGNVSPAKPGNASPPKPANASAPAPKPSNTTPSGVAKPPPTPPGNVPPPAPKKPPGAGSRS